MTPSLVLAILGVVLLGAYLLETVFAPPALPLAAAEAGEAVVATSE